MHLLDKAGRALIGYIVYVLYLLGFLYLSFKVIWVDRKLGQRDFFRQVLYQIYFTGVKAVGYVVILGLGVGAFAVVEVVGGVGAISGAEHLGKMVTVVVLREIAPAITGGIVIVRSVTAITTELGIMRVQREIEALEVMGISPIRQLIAPRIFGGIVSLFCLNVLFSLVALIGGFIIGNLLASIPADLFFRAVINATEPSQITAFLLKVIIGGVGFFVIACYHGMSVDRSSTDVPVAVSKAALNSFVFLIFLNTTISIIDILSSSTGEFIGGVL